MKIGIAGAGGIGSNVAVNLVRTGVSNLKIADFDTIDKSNLNRQFYFEEQIGEYKVEALCKNLKAIDKEAEIEVINRKLNAENIEETFKDCDIIVEAFDVKEMKKLLIEKFSSSKKLIVSASGIAHYDLENMRVHKIGRNIFVVGDFEKGIDKYGTYSTKVSIASAMMANIVLEKGGFYGKDK